jgi:uncharacterized membrane protein
MQEVRRMPNLSFLDILAVSLTVIAWLGIGYAIENPPRKRLSVSYLMQDYRRQWMRQMITRVPRVFDGTIIDSLRQGTAFFASASMIAVGGGLAIVGNPAVVMGIANDLPLSSDVANLRLRALFVVLFLANALLKFVWANRLFGYCAVMMGAVPNDPADPMAAVRAAQAADLNIHAAKSFNRGLRSIYFALGALGWLLGPYALMATTVLASAVLIRRDFASVSREIILRGG